MQAIDWTRATLGFVGLGNMGGALAGGVAASGLVGVDRIVGFDLAGGSLPDGARRATSAREVGQLCDAVVLAVKPHQIAAVAAEVSDTPQPPHVVVSVAAGLSTASIRAALGAGGPAVVRAMPNVAASVGASTTAIVGEPGCPSELAASVCELFAQVGEVVVLGDEEKMHVGTALVGSGPAFAFVFAEALADAAVADGMPREDARRCAASMLLGAARLLLADAASPAELKDRVGSPGGTTMAGIAALESRAFRSAVIAAMRAATARSREMGAEK